MLDADAELSRRAVEAHALGRLPDLLRLPIFAGRAHGLQVRSEGRVVRSKCSEFIGTGVPPVVKTKDRRPADPIGHPGFRQSKDESK